MLIVTSKAPGWGKQKPRQYNLAHAKASVRDNCEKWLGIDPQLIKLCFPFWENSDTITELIRGKQYTPQGTVTPVSDGLLFEKTGYYRISTSSLTAPFKKEDVQSKGLTFSCFIDPPFTGIHDNYQGDVFSSAGETSHYESSTGRLRVGRGCAYDYIHPRYYDGSYEGGVTPDAALETYSMPLRCTIVYDVPNGEIRVYANGNLIDTDTSPTAGNFSFNPNYFILGKNFKESDYALDSTLYSGEVFTQALSADQIAQLSETPYALLQPVAPVFYSIPSALVPRITYPSNDENDVSTTPTISWSAVAGATKYKLQVDTANTFDSGGGSGLLVLDSHSAISKATQKPKQWGPISAVQSAVKKNCEEWLGVPYESLKLCLPFWEGAGNTVHNIVGDDAHFGNGGDWEKNYAKTTSSNYGITIDNSEEIRPTDSFTLHIDIKRFNATITEHGKMLQKDLVGAPYVSYGLEFGYGSYIYLFKAVSSSYIDNRLRYSTGGLGVGDRLKITGVAGSRGLEIYRDGALVASDVSITGNIAYYDNSNLNILGEGALNAKLTEADVNQALMFDVDLTSKQVAMIDAQPYRLLQPTNNKVISIPTKAPLIEEEIIAPATSKQVTLAAGTTHYARVAADTP